MVLLSGYPFWSIRLRSAVLWTQPPNHLQWWASSQPWRTPATAVNTKGTGNLGEHLLPLAPFKKGFWELRNFWEASRNSQNGLHGHCMSFHITAVSSGIFSSKFWKTQRFSLVLSALPKMKSLEFTQRKTHSTFISSQSQRNFQYLSVFEWFKWIQSNFKLDLTLLIFPLRPWIDSWLGLWLTWHHLAPLGTTGASAISFASTSVFATGSSAESPSSVTVTTKSWPSAETEISEIHLFSNSFQFWNSVQFLSLALFNLSLLPLTAARRPNFSFLCRPRDCAITAQRQQWQERTERNDGNGGNAGRLSREPNRQYSYTPKSW